jgi:hypothetical protein
MKLNGADFVAVVRITNKPGDVLAAIGESCAKVPEKSLGWLEKSGRIRRREKPAAKPEGVDGETPMRPRPRAVRKAG